MKVVVCEMCGSRGLVKRGGLYVCGWCGTRYEAKEARKLLIEAPDEGAEGDSQEEGQVAEKMGPQVESLETEKNTEPLVAIEAEVDAKDEGPVAEKVEPQAEPLEIEEDEEDTESPATTEAEPRAESPEVADEEDAESPVIADTEPQAEPLEIEEGADAPVATEDERQVEAPAIAGADGEEKDAGTPTSRDEEPEERQQVGDEPLRVYLNWHEEGDSDVVMAEIHDTATNLDSCYAKRYVYPLGADRHTLSSSIADEIEGAMGRPVKWRMVEVVEEAVVVNQGRPRFNTKTVAAIVVAAIIACVLIVTLASRKEPPQSQSTGTNGQGYTVMADYSSLVSGELSSSKTRTTIRIEGDKLYEGQDTYTIEGYDEDDKRLILKDDATSERTTAKVKGKDYIWFRGYPFR